MTSGQPTSATADTDYALQTEAHRYNSCRASFSGSGASSRVIKPARFAHAVKQHVLLRVIVRMQSERERADGQAAVPHAMKPFDTSQN